MKNTKMKLIGVLMALVFLMAACGSNGNNSIVGSWAVEESGIEMVYTFEKDGKCAMSAFGVTLDGEYSLEDDQLILQMNGEPEPSIFGYKVDGKKLTLSMDDESLVLTKK